MQKKKISEEGRSEKKIKIVSDDLFFETGQVHSLGI